VKQNAARIMLILAGLWLGPAAIGLAASGESRNRQDPNVPAAAPLPAAGVAAFIDAPLAAVAGLQVELDQIVERSGRGSNRWSILAVSLDRGDTLFARSPDHVLAPASNMKLLTSAAALEYLGPGFRFTTYLFTDGVVRDGVLEGNLYIYGTGDPTIGTRFAPGPAPTLVAFADSLSALGIREIRGDVIGDGSFFSGPGYGEGWQADYLNSWYAANAGALSVHENLVRIEVSAAGGGPPELRFIPGGTGIAVRNEAVSEGAGRIDVRRVDYTGPIVVRGSSAGGTSSHAVPVNDPAMYAAALLRDVLLERDVIVHGGVRAIEDEAESLITGRRVFAPAFDDNGPRIRVLATRTSEPLSEILKPINQQSHNFYSEQVLRAIGRVAGGNGSVESGALAIKVLLHRAGVDTARVHVADGSGLSPLNAVSAADVVALLSYVAGTWYAEPFMASLPVAGEVRRFRRMGGTPAQGNLRAKTGTIDRVSALSGYVRSANGELIAFSIIGNDLSSVAQGKYIENLIGAQLAAFDRTAPVTLPAGDVAVAE
jgi:serine-type D-Ala-D-Ala carboxypeptidase/endopeptidase (penicillin-binding protein 4)